MPAPNPLADALVLPDLTDHRDLALQCFALSELEAREQGATWREIAQQAIHALAAQHVEIERLRRTTASQRGQLRDLLAEQPRLTEELQRLRGFLVRQTQGAA